MGNDLIVLDRKARRELEQLLTDGNTAQKIAKRARIVLMTADVHRAMRVLFGSVLALETPASP